MICPDCGEHIHDDFLYCPWCGFEVGEDDEEMEEESDIERDRR